MASDGDYSDLTDLDELSQEYEDPKSKKGKGKKKATGKSSEYRIHGALKAPRATTYSTEALYKQIHNGDINLEPDYQREVVWPESKQIGIIDSLFRNYYIPPVIFAVNSYDDGTESRTCIDGKQRLTSIHRFMEGLIPHKDSITGDKLWYRDNPNQRTRTKKMLPEKYRTMFDGKAVVCVEYQDIKDSHEREIFQRVQLGVALTPAEKLKVISTPRAKFIRELQDKFLNNDEGGLSGDALAWDRSRGSDFRCLSQTIQCIAVNPKTTSIQATEKWLTDPSAISSAFTSSIENTYHVFEELVLDPRNRSHFAKVAPIEFIMIGILVHRHKTKLTLEAMGKAVGAMRADVRRQHEDIRNNGKIYKAMINFIDNYKGPALGGQTSAADAVGARTKSGAGTKRKAGRARDDEDDDDDDDEDVDSDDDYAPAARQQAAPRKRTSPKKAASIPAPPAPAPVPPPTPPASNAPPASASPVPNAVDVIRAAKERLEAQRQLAVANALHPTPTHGHGLSSAPTMAGSPSLPGYAFNADGLQSYMQQTQALQQMLQQVTGTPVQGQGGQQLGAASVAAALEANLMAGRSGGGQGTGGMRVKSEPGAPPSSSSSGWDGGGGGGRYGSANGSMHRNGSGGGYERGKKYEYDDDYGGSGGRRDTRYRDNRDRRW